MAYTRRNTTDGVTVMNKDLYDNLQDGIEQFGVTPQMFGAVGDGAHDDTLAVQECIDYAIKNNKTVVAQQIYKLSQTININSANKFNFFGKNGKFIYSGTDYCFKLSEVRNSLFSFGIIISNQGSGIELVSYSNETNCQYVEIDGVVISALQNCIHINRVDGYVNEIRISNMKLSDGVNGILVSSSATYYDTNGIRIDKVGFEGVTNGICTKGGCSFELLDCRYGENFDKLIITEGRANIVIIGNHYLYYNKSLTLSPSTQGVIMSPIREDTGTPIDHFGYIINGNVVPVTFRSYNNLSSISLVDLSLDTSEKRFANYFIMGKTDSLILPNYYGVQNGINDFYLKCSFDSGTPKSLTIQGSTVNLLADTSKIGWKTIHFKWISEVGWIRENIFNEIK